jgi:hypothetical protein
MRPSLSGYFTLRSPKSNAYVSFDQYGLAVSSQHSSWSEASMSACSLFLKRPAARKVPSKVVAIELENEKQQAQSDRQLMKQLTTAEQQLEQQKQRQHASKMADLTSVPFAAESRTQPPSSTESPSLQEQLQRWAASRSVNVKGASTGAVMERKRPSYLNSARNKITVAWPNDLDIN